MIGSVIGLSGLLGVTEFLSPSTKKGEALHFKEVGFSLQRGSPQSRGYSKRRRRIIEALQILEQTRAGSRLLEKAKEKWQWDQLEQLATLFRWGNVSKTDAILTRQLDLQNGKEVYSREVTIFLKWNQTLSELVLDLAHELTHATHGPAWNPYDPNLTAARYIQLAIEGDGGEVDALYAECKIAGELSQRYGMEFERCRDFESKDAQGLSRSIIRDEFYKVGQHREALEKNLKNSRLPLSSNEPSLISSTGNAPYPVALFYEFQELNRIACLNTQRRLASLSSSTSIKKTNDSVAFMDKRCQSKQQEVSSTRSSSTHQR